MKFSVYAEKAPSKKTETFFRLREHYDGGVLVEEVDETGERLSQGALLSISDSGVKLFADFKGSGSIPTVLGGKAKLV